MCLRKGRLGIKGEELPAGFCLALFKFLPPRTPAELLGLHMHRKGVALHLLPHRHRGGPGWGLEECAWGPSIPMVLWDAQTHGSYPLTSTEHAGSPQARFDGGCFVSHLVRNKLALWDKPALSMIFFCCFDFSSAAHVSVTSSWRHSLVDPNPPASQPGKSKVHVVVSSLACLFSFHGGFFIFYFFRALSQDDQDDIHLKLEDIIQLVSPAIVSSHRLMCKLLLRGEQYYARN